MLAKLGYDGEHVRLENLAAIVARQRCKECGAGDDAVGPGLFADMLAHVLHVVCNGGDTTARNLNLSKFLRWYAHTLWRNASRSLCRRSQCSGIRRAPLIIKSKPVSWRSGTGLTAGDLG